MNTFLTRQWHGLTQRLTRTGLCLLGLALSAPMAWADVGMDQIPAHDQDGPVTLYYPTAAPAQDVQRGPFTLRLAVGAAPQAGNGRLVVISHGSGGSPWVHADLASALVQAGFVVAMPEHQGDNYHDASQAGPQSWLQRPQEVSRAIDAVAHDARLAPLLHLDKVGMYGMSAGGHTALSLAGGQFAPAGFARHCQAHLAEDFAFCVGLHTHLTGSWADGLRKTIALWVINYRFADTSLHQHTDPRIAAIVAAVPAAADFELATLAQPRVPLALVGAGQDLWLRPQFHSEAVLAQCKSCERLVTLADGGHGALLSPFPAQLGGIAGELLNDPPGYDRVRGSAVVNQKTTQFFVRQLLP